MSNNVINLTIDDLKSYDYYTSEPREEKNYPVYYLPQKLLNLPHELSSNKQDSTLGLYYLRFTSKNGVFVYKISKQLINSWVIDVFFLQFKDTGLYNKLKSLVYKTKIELHTAYAISIMWYYLDYSSTATYEEYIQLLLTLKLPKQAKTLKLPLYRGIAISESGYKGLQQGKTLKLKPRYGTSWTPHKTRSRYVGKIFSKQYHTYNKGSQDINIKLPRVILIELNETNSSKARVILNGFELLKLPQIKAFIKNVPDYGYRVKSCLSEVLLKGNGGIDKVKQSDLTSPIKK